MTTTKSTSQRFSRTAGAPRPAAPTRKQGKVSGQMAAKPVVKHAHVATSAKRAVTFVGSSEVKSEIANAVRREVGRQLRVMGAASPAVRHDDETLRAVRAYAREVFGSAEKANRWLERPSVRLGGESPVSWLQTHDDPADVYSALDAIAYGAPV
ncbi:MbcA/ParS/Xre antitoxin family protein [Burkholderia ambifaria]|uniref:MbcA/ParS/Xre antitoxin family protein n=1 Tax=Burkholderia ambifaria TaxID=152480 RepID=UPI001589B566|nr:MbcA/ParS/Xre antitoxin family protein [Burkholderia ambifaria]